MKTKTQVAGILFTLVFVPNIAKAYQVNGYEIAPNANLNFANLNNANLANANLAGATLQFAQLSHTNFTNSNLTNSNFYHANATYANFTNAIIDNYSAFGYADLTGANFTGAVFNNSYFNGADITGITVSYSNWNDFVLNSGARQLDSSYQNTINYAGPAPVVPEPSTYGLIGIGALGVAFASRRKQE
jgi:uncharacterized protein YjbI with pentapeptide repeats